MLLWSTLGVVRRYINFPSEFICLVRGAMAVLVLAGVLLAMGRKFDWAGVRQNLLPLVLGGMLLGTNWAFLFEAYQNTDVAIAELCYFTYPVFVTLLAPTVLREYIPFRQWVCCILALVGMVLVSGAYQQSIGEGDLLGVLLAVLAAAEVAGFIFCNKHISGLGSYECAIVEMFMATLVLLPYTLLTDDWTAIAGADALSWGLTLMLGAVHTGFAYYIYFKGILGLRAQEICILGFADPIMVIILGMVVLGEMLNGVQLVGAAIIVVSMMYAELRR